MTQHGAPSKVSNSMSSRLRYLLLILPAAAYLGVAAIDKARAELKARSDISALEAAVDVEDWRDVERIIDSARISSEHLSRSEKATGAQKDLAILKAVEGCFSKSARSTCADLASVAPQSELLLAAKRALARSGVPRGRIFDVWMGTRKPFESADDMRVAERQLKSYEDVFGSSEATRKAHDSLDALNQALQAPVEKERSTSETQLRDLIRREEDLQKDVSRYRILSGVVVAQLDSGDDLLKSYEVALGWDGSSRAVLVTGKTEFTSKGRFSVAVERAGEVQVTVDGGFKQTWPRFTEAAGAAAKFEELEAAKAAREIAESAVSNRRESFQAAKGRVRELKSHVSKVFAEAQSAENSRAAGVINDLHND